jgi:hypothetical protein
MNAGTVSKNPDSHSTSGRQATSPEARTIQSSSVLSYFTARRCTSMTTRSKVALDSESAVLSGSRKVAPASSSSTGLAA